MFRIILAVGVFLVWSVSAQGGGPSADRLSDLDLVWSDCLTCHGDDETFHSHLCGTSLMTPGGQAGSSVTYDRLAIANKELRPIEQLPPELVFYEGKVTCATCHGLRPHDGQLTVISNSGSQLCRACHIK